MKFTRKEFLETLFQEYFRSREGFIIIRCIRNHDNRITTRYFPNIELLSKEEYNPDQHVYFGCCPRESMKPEAQHVKYLLAIWAGLDLGPDGYSGKQVYFFGQPQAAKAVRSFPLPPSIIVESGWGLHLYWLMREIVRIDNPQRIRNILFKVNNYFQCKSEIGLDSILRLPDTTNCKVPTHVIDCRVKYINPDFRYDLDDFENLNLGVAGETPQTSTFIRGAIRNNEMAEVARAEAASPHYDGEHENAQETEPLQSTPESQDDEEPGFEPLPYEIIEESPSTPIPEELISRVADQIIEQITPAIIDKVADAIADRIIKRMRQMQADKK